MAGPGNSDRMPNAKLIRRTIATAVAASAFVAAAAGPASADVVRPYDLYTSKVKTPGQAHVYGNVRFLSNGNVSITGNLNDVCPEDGYGAYVYFTNYIENGNYATAKDLRGCNASGSVPFAVTYTRASYESRIDEVHILLKEYDQINPPWGAWIRGDENSFVVTRR
jgi:hypothetical protein